MEKVDNIIATNINIINTNIYSNNNNKNRV